MMGKGEGSAAEPWLWRSDFWLPPNVTWEDLKPDHDSGEPTFADFNHLGYPIVIGVVIVLLRYLVENAAFRPLGRRLDIKDHRRPIPSRLNGSPELELEFRRPQSWGHEVVTRLSRKLKASEREVEVWLRYRRKLTHPSKLDKFCETGWRWVFYTGAISYGLWVLWSKKWFWDIVDCWFGYPFHPVEADVWWYYMVELSFYWCLFFSQFLGDVKRKDFWTMFTHHVATIMLLSFSWVCHLQKAGTLIMICHDVSDVFLESAKLCLYAGMNSWANIVFALYTIVWIATRLGFYPTWIIYSITMEAPQMVQFFPAYLVLCSLLSILLALNILWTYSILKVSYLTIFKPCNDIEDVRSQSSESSPDGMGSDGDKPKKKKDL